MILDNSDEPINNSATSEFENEKVFTKFYTNNN